MEDVHQLFLTDLVSWLKQQLGEINRSRQRNSAFESGRGLAYAEIIGHMPSQADVLLTGTL